MQIIIKKIGYKNGTSGWLAAGLADGTLELSEGRLKSNGNHGLWIKSADGKISACIAAINEYGMDLQDCIHAGCQLAEMDRYKVVCDTRPPVFTDAAWSAIEAIAQTWCDECNAERDADGCVRLEIKRVEAAHA